MGVLLTATGAYLPGELAPSFRTFADGTRRKCAEKVRSVRRRVGRTSAAVVSVIDHFRGLWRRLDRLRQRRQPRTPRRRPSRGPAGTVPCGGKNALTAEGSTAQQNAIASFNHVWGQSCPGQKRVVQPHRVGCRPRAIHCRPRRLRRIGLAADLGSDRARPPNAATETRRGTCRWCSGPVALVYNLPGVHDVGRQQRRAGQDLQRRDHEVERSDTGRTQSGCCPARHQDHADLPGGLVGNH